MKSQNSIGSVYRTEMSGTSWVPMGARDSVNAGCCVDVSRTCICSATTIERAFN